MNAYNEGKLTCIFPAKFPATSHPAQLHFSLPLLKVNSEPVS